MERRFQAYAREVVAVGVASARRCRDAVDHRAALCRWEDALFAEFLRGHEILSEDEAVRLIGNVFAACGRAPAALRIVPGFQDPRIGGYADIAGHAILIEKGFLYRFLLLHEAAHILVPEDLHHGPGFIYVLQHLYRDFIGIPQTRILQLLRRFGLPSGPATEPALASAA
jgi:hypothetical protein